MNLKTIHFRALTPAKILTLPRQGLPQWLSRVFHLARSVRVGGSRRLRLGEWLGLGEHRFAAVLEFDGQRFLVGGTPHSLSLLAELTCANAGDSQSDAKKTNAGETPSNEILPGNREDRR